MYVICNRDEFGVLREVFVILGKSGGCGASQLEGVGRLISRSLRYGIPLPAIIKDLRGIRCHTPSWESGVEITSCMDAIGQVLEEELAWEQTDDFKKRFGGNQPDAAGEGADQGVCDGQEGGVQAEVVDDAAGPVEKGEPQ